MSDIVERLRTSPPNVLLQREAADAIERLRRQLKEAERETREAARGAAEEAYWQARQEAAGDYGSY